MTDEIRTERLLLRRARHEDATAMHAIMSDPTVMRYWSSLSHTSLAETERWMASMVALDPAASDDFIVTYQGRLIGKLGTYALPEIGYLIARDQWGQGFASEALGAFIARRRTLGSTELTADVDPRNTASLRLIERHGFIETGRATGTWLIGDELCDSVYLKLTL
ncbi:MAG: GNAT family N-acetyltransferase [Sphingomonas bacterium]|nr:GNAT family N-acetyltransferase [Sphingomonas bacterium]